MLWLKLLIIILMPHNQLWQYRIFVLRQDSVNYASTKFAEIKLSISNFFQSTISNILYYEKKLLFRHKLYIVDFYTGINGREIQLSKY